MTDKGCFFIGHRNAPDTVQAELNGAVERCIAEYGIECFTVGHYGSFDRMAARAVVDAKERHPQVTLFLLLPYHPAERPIRTPPGFDGTYYPECMKHVPRRLAIIRANRYMADHSTCLISYVRHTASNARDLLEYAQAREKRGLMRVIAL